MRKNICKFLGKRCFQVRVKQGTSLSLKQTFIFKLKADIHFQVCSQHYVAFFFYILFLYFTEHIAEFIYGKV